MATKVFLGGTCNETTWRDYVISRLEQMDIDYFNPVVKDWTPECQKEEDVQKKICDISLYVITPKMTGVYSIAEVVDDSNKKPKNTILCILEKDDDKQFNEFEMRSLNKMAQMVRNNGATVVNNLNDVVKEIYIHKKIK